MDARYAPGQAVVFADELGDEGIGGLLVQFVRCRQLLHHALVEHADAISHGQGLGLIVGDVNHSDAQIVVDVLDFVLHLLAQLLVQGPQGLVHQDQVRLEHQGAGDGHTLLLTAGQLRRAAAAEIGQFDHLQRAGDLGRDLGLGHVAYA